MRFVCLSLASRRWNTMSQCLQLMFSGCPLCIIWMWSLSVCSWLNIFPHSLHMNPPSCFDCLWLKLTRKKWKWDDQWRGKISLTVSIGWTGQMLCHNQDDHTCSHVCFHVWPWCGGGGSGCLSTPCHIYHMCVEVDHHPCPSVQSAIQESPWASRIVILIGWIMLIWMKRGW